MGQRSKVTGLYLLLLLTKGDYAGFHTLLEGLEVQATEEGLEGDVFIRYPVMLEQWLMEGAYDRVWGAMKGKGVPSEEFAVFSEVGCDHDMDGDCGYELRYLLRRFLKGSVFFDDVF